MRVTAPVSSITDVTQVLPQTIGDFPDQKTLDPRRESGYIFTCPTARYLGLAVLETRDPGTVDFLTPCHPLFLSRRKGNFSFAYFGFRIDGRQNWDRERNRYYFPTVGIAPDSPFSPARRSSPLISCPTHVDRRRNRLVSPYTCGEVYNRYSRSHSM